MYPKEVYDQIKAISAELRPDCIRFIQKLIQTPSMKRRGRGSSKCVN